MEVHHHGHTPKKWTDYITEFVMLFAAVTLGFLAENFREHQIENHRAKEYLELFKMEIKRNNNAIDSVLKFGTPVLIQNEKLYFSLFSDKNISNETIAKSMDLMVYRFSNDKRIFELMKNSGSLRYIKDKKLIEEINAYETDADFAEFRTFDQESSAGKLFWDFLVQKMPPALLMKWLNRPDLDYISSLSPAYAGLYAANQQAIEADLKNVQLPEDVKIVLMKYLMNKCTIQKLSILNLKIIKEKSDPLLSHIDTYLANN
ncbi:hypothetical protein [Aquirufa regiilacus]|uniref:Uncharacterized protein n=1 Tax=Aquirufa regiilacus TaxID=3024868 RepID=A0ABU3TUT5_9BACT|nr:MULTISPECIES: hypothetical protein [unclassified Aquirufa]MDT8887908.1 hypothetical protein [Aquirufa sp. LEPPI-3A]MDU0809641.1 hypothetical protein [Aquirufa sp. LEOWEIH-7C]